MVDQRLPIVDSDDGIWGDILRQYLLKEHYNGDTDLTAGTSENGGHKTITIQPGTASAGTAPLKFTSGALLTSPEAGAIEFLTDTLYFTDTSGPTRKVLASYAVSGGAEGDIYYRNSAGAFTRLAIGGSNGDILTVNSGIPSWQTPTYISGTGMLEPVQAHTDGSETYTISSGTVTQISGTTIHSTLYTPAIGDRILITTAPASSGSGTIGQRTTQPANGIYTVTSNTTNLSLSRSSDLSGSVHPAGLRVYSESPALTWMPNAVFTVTTPQGPGSFTYGTNNITLSTPAVTSDYLYINTATNSINISNGTGYTTIQPTASSGNQILTLPSTATSDTLVGRASTDTLTNKTLTSPIVNELLDSNGNAVLGIASSSTPVNNIAIYNSDTGSSPGVVAGGSDTDVNLILQPQNAGQVLIWKTTGNSTATIMGAGADTDINLDLTTQGSGVVKANNVEVATISGTQTLTNKRNTPRVSTTTSSATPTINTDNVDIYGLTALAVDITSFTTNLSGTPTNGQSLYIYIVGTATRNITWGASFADGAAALPTATDGTDRLDVGFMWDSSASVWRCMATSEASSAGDMLASTYDSAGVSEQLVGLTATQTLTNKTLTAPKINLIKDSNNNNLVGLTTTASAVNNIAIGNGATGQYPFISISGSDTDVGLDFIPQGAGPVRIYESSGSVATLSSAGVGSNIDLNLTAKGTGVVQANGVEVATKDDIVHTPTAIWGDGVISSSIQVGTVTYLRVPYAGTITEWHIVANASTTCTLDIWKDTTLPTNADSITASAKPALTTATTASSSTLTGWTTSVSSGDIFGFELEALSAGTPSEITLTLRIE